MSPDATLVVDGPPSDTLPQATVVTADRELRDRVAAVRADAGLVGPTWLRDRLEPPHRGGG